MPEPETGGCQGDGGEGVSDELVVARGDGAEVFEFVEEALDEVALAVERGIDGTLDQAVTPGRDAWPGAVSGDEFEDGMGVVAAVGDDAALDGRNT